MPAPNTVLVVTNVGVSSAWAGGVEIAPNASATFTTSGIAPVFADMNFWAGFLSDTLTITINGQGIPANSGPVVAFLIEIALGNIAPT